MDIKSLLCRFAIAPPPVPASWYAIPLRLIVGFGFIEHGYAKLARGADGFIIILHAIGMPFADLLGWATIAVEILGGLLILAGAFVPVATVPVIVVLLVAIFTVHLPNGFSSIKLQSRGEGRRNVSFDLRPAFSHVRGRNILHPLGASMPWTRLQ